MVSSWTQTLTSKEFPTLCITNQYIKRKNQSTEGGEVSDEGEVDQAFTTAKDVAIFTLTGSCGEHRRVVRGYVHRV